MSRFDFLSEVEPFKTGWKVRVKVLKLWSLDYLVGDSMEMIITDEKGTRYQATVLPKDVPQFEGRIKEGDWIFLRWFKVTKDSSVGLKCCPYSLKIQFLPFTRVRPCDPVTGSLLIQPTRFFDIVDRAYASDYLIDVVGVVHRKGDLCRIPTRSGTGMYFNLRFELVNPERDVILPCVARESLAKELYWQLTRSEEEHIVCVLRFWLASEGHGIDANSVVLSSSSLSDFILNPDDPVVEEVLSKYLAK